MDDTPPRQESGSRAPIRSGVNLLLFALSFVLACFVAGRSLPFPDVPNVRPKLDWLAKHGDEFDVILLGSSRVQKGIIPSIFDRVATEGGRPVHSFNAGIPAMVPPEDAYMLEQILRRPHRRLRWVAIELQTFGREFDEMIEGTARMDYWHDARRVGFLTRHLAGEYSDASQAGGASRWVRFRLCADALAEWANHLRQFGRRATNYGHGASLLAAHLRGGREHSKLEKGGAAGDGWLTPVESGLMEGKDLAIYERGLNNLREVPRNLAEDAVAEQSLRGMIDLLRRQGIEPILFIPPTLTRSQFYPKGLLATVTLFDLSDPARYPELYDAVNRRDAMHLNLAGAALFSRQLGTLFAAHTKL